MQNTQFQTIPGFGNFGTNTGTTTGFPWGETAGYGSPFTGTTAYGLNNGQNYYTAYPLLQTLVNGLGQTAIQSIASGLTTGQGIASSTAHGHGLLQALFSATGLVLGPINGGVNSFIGNVLESGQSSVISSFLTLAQGVSSAQTIASSGTTVGQTVTGTGTTQGLTSSFLTSLIRVRYYDNNSTFVVGAEIAGGNSKNINVTVVGDEIRITKTETGSTGKNVVSAGNFGSTSSYYALPLPTTADAKAITAVVKDGLLTITLQKAKEISKNVHQVTVK